METININREDTSLVIKSEADRKQEAEQRVLARVNKKWLADKLKSDKAFFITYFTEPDKAIPPFHLQTFYKMKQTLYRGVDSPFSELRKLCIAMPRGHAKTFLVKLASLDEMLFGTRTNFLYVSNTLEHSAASCMDIVRQLESPKVTALFNGQPINFLVRQESKGKYIFTIPGRDELYYLRAAGMNQQIRGNNVNEKRPDAIIIDDLEDRKTNKSDVLFTEFTEWFFSDLYKAGASNCAMIMIGNIVSSRSLLDTFCNAPDWESIRYGAILENGQPLWPDLWPLTRLQDDFTTYNKLGMSHIWFGEMMNQVMSASNLINIEEIQFMDRREAFHCMHTFITVDPAIADGERAHNMGIAVHGLIDDPIKPYWQIVDYRLLKGTDPIQLYHILHDLAYFWNVNCIGIESVAYQAALKPTFEYLDTISSSPFHLQYIQMPSGGKSKYSRIATWCGYLKSGEYRLSKGDTITVQQLMKFNPQSKQNDDDLIDVEAYGIYMITNHISTIVASQARRGSNRLVPKIITADENDLIFG